MDRYGERECNDPDKYCHIGYLDSIIRTIQNSKHQARNSKRFGFRYSDLEFIYIWHTFATIVIKEQYQADKARTTEVLLENAGRKELQRP